MSYSWKTGDGVVVGVDGDGVGGDGDGDDDALVIGDARDEVILTAAFKTIKVEVIPVAS